MKDRNEALRVCSVKPKGGRPASVTRRKVRWPHRSRRTSNSLYATDLWNHLWRRSKAANETIAERSADDATGSLPTG
jgi:hypothetical protein